MKILLIAASIAGLCLAAAPVRAADDVSGNWVRFQTWGQDSLALYATYYPTAPGRSPVALLLHDRAGEGSDLGVLATKFARAGIPVLLPDLRGEGESTSSQRGRVGPAERWGAAELPLLVKDMEGIFAFAEAQVALRDRGWVVVAEGAAGGIALAMAESDRRLVGVVLLSPLTLGREFDLASLEIPVLLLACAADEASVETVETLYRGLPTDLRRMDVMPCRSRGHRMLNWVTDLAGRIADWTLNL